MSADRTPWRDPPRDIVLLAIRVEEPLHAPVTGAPDGRFWRLTCNGRSLSVAPEVIGDAVGGLGAIAVIVAERLAPGDPPPFRAVPVYERIASSHASDPPPGPFGPPEFPYDPPPPTGHNCDVMAVLPDGRRGYYDTGHLWTSTGTTLHSPREAEASARQARREHGDRARFFAVDAGYGDTWEPICTIDGGPPTIVKCADCDSWVYRPPCPFCSPPPDDPTPCSQCGDDGSEGFHVCQAFIESSNED